jgi:hypothetical protein
MQRHRICRCVLGGGARKLRQGQYECGAHLLCSFAFEPSRMPLWFGFGQALCQWCLPHLPSAASHCTT